MNCKKKKNAPLFLLFRVHRIITTARKMMTSDETTDATIGMTVLFSSLHGGD